MPAMPSFEILCDEVTYQQQLIVFSQTTRFSYPTAAGDDGSRETKDVVWDIVSHPPPHSTASLFLPFHPSVNGMESEFTLLREYCQGPNIVSYSLPSVSGGDSTDPDLKHVRGPGAGVVGGGELVRLIPESCKGIYEVKWCRNHFVPFLVIDPQVDLNPGPRDPEEHIEVQRVTLSELLRILSHGEIMLPSLITCQMALEMLQTRGLLLGTPGPPRPPHATFSSFSPSPSHVPSSRDPLSSGTTALGNLASGGPKQPRLSSPPRASPSSSTAKVAPPPLPTLPSSAFPKFEIIGERVAYKRYLTIFSQTTRITSLSSTRPESREVEWDIVGHPRANYMFTVVFPFHPAAEGREAEVTLIREYCQAPHSILYSLPTGGLDPKKHADISQCARAELSEEFVSIPVHMSQALLMDGEMVRLIPESCKGICEVKWCRNHFVPFLVIDPQVDPNPGPRDLEEHIEVHRVPLSELLRILKTGAMLPPSIATCYKALEELQSRGLVAFIR